MKNKAHLFEINQTYRPGTELPGFLKDRQPIVSQIKSLREALGMSQAQLAARAGIRQSQLAQIENHPGGDYQISTVNRLAAALNCHLLTALIPDKEIEKILDQKAEKLARKLLKISSGQAALELQLPEKKYRDFQLRQMKEEILDKYRRDLWTND